MSNAACAAARSEPPPGRTPRRGGRRRLASACVIVCLGLSAGAPASAQRAVPDDEAAAVVQVEALSKEGVALYQLGRYDEALVSFRKALAVRPVANLLFNIGRTLEKLGRSEEALTYYQRFVDAPDASGDGIDKARARIVALRTAPDPTPTPGPGVEHAALDPAWVHQSRPAQGLGAMEVAGWATLGAGLAVLAGAVGLAIAAGVEESSFSDADTLSAKQRHRDRASGFALGADIGFGVGGAAAATGLGLLIASWVDDGSSSQALWIAPQWGRDAAGRAAAGFGLGGSF